MATSRGVVKRVKTYDFRNARTKGIIAIKLDEGDRLVDSLLTSGNEEVIIITRAGSALRFNEERVRSMGRATRGVRGIKLKNNDELAGILRTIDDNKIMVLTENGFGKRVEYDKFTPHGRGTGGQNIYKTDERTGEIIGVQSVSEFDDIICISSQGNTIKINVAQISIQGKNTQGITVVNLKKPDIVVSVAKAIHDKEEVEEGTEVEAGVEIEVDTETEEKTEE